MQERNSSSPRKPWPMRWVVLAILAFVIGYSIITIRFRKEGEAHLPYESMHLRSGHELQQVGWQPFPNAYGIPADAPELNHLPAEAQATMEIREIAFEKLSPEDPRIADWSGEIPSLAQGEQLLKIEAPEKVEAGDPYIARIFWEMPDDFRSPQLIVFHKANQILIVPRAPERILKGSRTQTLFIIPPDQLEPGTYEIFLSTEDRVNRWTFRAD